MGCPRVLLYFRDMKGVHRRTDQWLLSRAACRAVNFCVGKFPVMLLDKTFWCQFCVALSAIRDVCYPRYNWCQLDSLTTSSLAMRPPTGP